MKMVQRKTWEEFRKIGMLWWINRMLHMFGWAIVFDFDDKSGKVKEVYPARVKFRGFDEKTETEGFIKVSEYLKKNIDKVHQESLE